MGGPNAHPSTPELLTLHAVRLRGMADDAEVADRFELDRSVSDELLLDFEAYGWVTRVEFAGTAAWMLTAAGRSEEERRLADELAATGSGPEVHDAYRTFQPLNGRLLKACTEWQLRPAPGDTLASNDHTDIVWDQRVLAELAALGDDLVGVGSRLSARLARFGGYETRYRAALTRAHQRRAGLGHPPASRLLSHRVDGAARGPAGHARDRAGRRARPGAVGQGRLQELTEFGIGCAGPARRGSSGRRLGENGGRAPLP